MPTSRDGLGGGSGHRRVLASGGPSTGQSGRMETPKPSATCCAICSMPSSSKRTFGLMPWPREPFIQYDRQGVAGKRAEENPPAPRTKTKERVEVADNEQIAQLGWEGFGG